MPRTQVTIWGAPKEIAIPKIAAMHQPQEIRLAIAMAPSTMTRITATGVSQASMLVCSAVAQVMKGDAWARASSGSRHRRLVLSTSAAGLALVAERILMLAPLLKFVFPEWGSHGITRAFAKGASVSKDLARILQILSVPAPAKCHETRYRFENQSAFE